MDNALVRMFDNISKEVPAFNLGQAVEEANALYLSYAAEMNARQLEDELYFAIRDSHRQQTKAQRSEGNIAADHSVMAHVFRLEAYKIVKQLQELDGYMMPAYLKALYESLGT